MKNIITVLLLTFCTFTFAQKQAVKTNDATATFNFFAKETKGTLSEIKAVISIDKDDLSKSVVMGSVSVASLSTENEGRDKHLMSADFFDVEKYPTMLFESAGFEIKDKQLISKGSLTIKAVTKEVEFIITEMDGNLVFTAMIYSSDFNINVKKKREENKIEVVVMVPFSN